MPSAKNSDIISFTKGIGYHCTDTFSTTSISKYTNYKANTLFNHLFLNS